jgi:hypothetical protein
MRNNPKSVIRGMDPGFRQGGGPGMSVIPAEAGIHPNFFHLNLTPEINPNTTLTSLYHNALP